MTFTKILMLMTSVQLRTFFNLDFETICWLDLLHVFAYKGKYALAHLNTCTILYITSIIQNLDEKTAGGIACSKKEIFEPTVVRYEPLQVRTFRLIPYIVVLLIFVLMHRA